MKYGTAKIAISIPKDIFRMIEEARRELKIPRSTAIVEAIDGWLKRRTEEKEIHQYIEGYRKHPEKVSSAETNARLKMAAEAFHKEGGWS